MISKTTSTYLSILGRLGAGTCHAAWEICCSVARAQIRFGGHYTQYEEYRLGSLPAIQNSPRRRDWLHATLNNKTN